MCNSIAIKNFKRNFEFQATKRCLALTSNNMNRTLKISTNILQTMVNGYVAISDIALLELVMLRFMANKVLKNDTIYNLMKWVWTLILKITTLHHRYQWRITLRRYSEI
jgi:hypothetical protein